MVKHFCTIR